MTVQYLHLFNIVHSQVRLKDESGIIDLKVGVISDRADKTTH